jgi:hypothetical protein
LPTICLVPPLLLSSFLLSSFLLQLLLLIHLLQPDTSVGAVSLASKSCKLHNSEPFSVLERPRNPVNYYFSHRGLEQPGTSNAQPPPQKKGGKRAAPPPPPKPNNNNSDAAPKGKRGRK